MPNLFDYTDYRKYLEDYQKAAHENNPHFSHRYFAQKAGFSSSGLLANIMKGRRNLTDALIGKFAHALKLTKKEHLYFEALVRFNIVVFLPNPGFHSQIIIILCCFLSEYRNAAIPV